MSYVPLPAFEPNEVLTAAEMNAILDNLDETAPAKVTTAGDIVYAVGDKEITRLALGGEGQLLKAGAGAPEWVDGGSFLAGSNTAEGTTSSTGVVSEVTGLSIPAGTPVRIVFEYRAGPSDNAGGIALRVQLNGADVTLSSSATGTSTEARNGIGEVVIGAREAGYLRSGVFRPAGQGLSTIVIPVDTDMPATITSFGVNVSANAQGKEVGVKNIRVYTEAI